MNRSKLGKSILSFVLVVGAVVATAVDWNTTHLFNPTWHPHARFHDALFLLFFDGMSPRALASYGLTKRGCGTQCACPAILYFGPRH